MFFVCLFLGCFAVNFCYYFVCFVSEGWHNYIFYLDVLLFPQTKK